MNRLITEGFSIENAFKALNAKPKASKKQIRESLNEASQDTAQQVLDELKTRIREERIPKDDTFIRCGDEIFSVSWEDDPETLDVSDIEDFIEDSYDEQDNVTINKIISDFTNVNLTLTDRYGGRLTFGIMTSWEYCDDFDDIAEAASTDVPQVKAKRNLVKSMSIEEAFKTLSIKEEFENVGTYPYLYISLTGDEYEDIMTDEEIDKAYSTNTFTDKMWLKGEAYITKENGYYQVSWGDFDDYREASSIEKCKKIVQNYHPYGFKWLNQ